MIDCHFSRYIPWCSNIVLSFNHVAIVMSYFDPLLLEMSCYLWMNHIINCLQITLAIGLVDGLTKPKCNRGKLSGSCIFHFKMQTTYLVQTGLGPVNFNTNCLYKSLVRQCHTIMLVFDWHTPLMMMWVNSYEQMIEVCKSSIWVLTLVFKYKDQEKTWHVLY
jgi:hypothetical protein